MKRLLAILAQVVTVAALPLTAQTATPAAPAAAPTTPAAAPAATESAVPHSGEWVTGWVETGYRWDSGPAGSLETYRSVVNLGAGLKLTGLDLTFTDPHHRAFDEIHVEAYDWSDPFSTLRVTAEKKAIYRLTASYRSLAYFNNLPSFADPLISTGVMLDEQSFDARRHIASVELHLLPYKAVSPYLAFDHDSDTGRGVNTFQTVDDEFAVPYTTTDVTNLYRGGVNISTERMHMTVEGGGSTFQSNQSSYQTGGTNPGNSSALILGQALDLTGLAEGLGVRGTGQYFRTVVSADPFNWLNIEGRFGYSNATNSVNYVQYDTGNMILLSQVLFYSGERFLEGAAAHLPHTSGEAGWQIRLPKWVRFDQHWLTDQIRSSGSSNSSDTLLGGGQTTVLPANYSSALDTNYNEVETEVLADFGAFRLRGAHRYEWGDANDLVLPQTGLLTVESSKLRRNIVMGSISWRVFSKLRTNADFEWGMSGSEYYRTSLYNYRKARVMARYDVAPTLHLSVDYRILGNKNPLDGSPYKSLSHQESMSLQWIPKGQKFDFVGTWEHCSYQTDMIFLDPGDLVATVGNYREDCHDVNASINTTLPGFLKKARISAGGSALLTSGSNPTTYYTPTVKLSAPLARHVGWFALWQYYGFNEMFYGYERFRAHLFTTGLRFSL